LCAACLAKGKVTPATIADHVEHHEGDWNRFILGRLRSLCALCHLEKHVVLRCGPRVHYGAGGWPIENDGSTTPARPNAIPTQAEEE
jgi:hypothetical protein